MDQALRELSLDDPRRLRLLSPEQGKLLAYLGYEPATEMYGRGPFHNVAELLLSYDGAIEIAWFILYAKSNYWSERGAVNIVYEALATGEDWDLPYSRGLATRRADCASMFEVCYHRLGRAFASRELQERLAQIQLKENLLPWLQRGVVPKPYFFSHVNTNYRTKKRYYNHLQRHCSKSCRFCRRNALMV